ncbi:hypothetical protein KPA93_25060 [Burkholderia cenocepacia]|uniref:hypothetical protein n=1 Tax=Burkholderia cenocepacia TaxID=95486 RepID=UPI00285C94E8|nr:hypothetical protein [Burkholderia cenocepacia]MDR8026495.1 hypothetical protein [Burkholderia cenocepacia]MDR8043749.1 hypothetical protein [Burkholderia cenocepacia]
MVAVASQPPVRLPAGQTTDAPWQPLADCGAGNPFFYHGVQDDFDSSLTTSIWTQSKTGNGSVAHTAGDGGLALFTTNSSTPVGTDYAAIQLPAASFTFTKPKKFFFLARLQVSDAVNAGFIAGLVDSQANPFVSPTDGLYFLKASGAANNLILRSMVGSANTDLAIPTSAYSLANNTNIDLAFAIDRNGNVGAYVGGQLVGFIPQSGVGSVNPSRGACAKFAPTLTTANLNLTLGVLSGTASSKTMTADFVTAQKER